MFCPKCGTANPDQAKFCRACGTNLETVALALSGQAASANQGAITKRGKEKDEKPTTREGWIEKRTKGVRQTVQGAILLGFALLIGVVGMGVTLGSGSNPFAWLAMWLVFVGWMAGWGVIWLALGIGDMIESKAMLGEWKRVGREQTSTATTPLLTGADEVGIMPGALAAPEQLPPLSVTEHTTQALGSHRPLQPDVIPPEKEKE